MPKGSYAISATKDNEDIQFQLLDDDTGDIPQDQQDLAIAVTGTLEVIKALYRKKGVSSPVYEYYFNQLLRLAQTGLVGATAQPGLAKRALDQLKIEITNREGGLVKNNYLKKLGGYAFWYGIFTLFFGTLLEYLVCRGTAGCCLNWNYTAVLLLIWSGTMLGVWLSFGITRTTIGFDDLNIIEKDRLEPSIRLLFTGALGIIFGLLFLTKAVKISLGSLSSENLLNDPVTSFLIGVILGLNEKIIGSTLTRKTSGLFDSK